MAVDDQARNRYFKSRQITVETLLLVASQLRLVSQSPLYNGCAVFGEGSSEAYMF